MEFFDLISGSPVHTEKYDIYPPKLKDIRDIGYDQYRSLLSVFLLSKEDIFGLFGKEVPDEATNFDVLQLITLVPDIRETLCSALMFFVHEEVYYSEETGYSLGADKVYLSFDEIWKIRNIILEFCCVESKENQAPKSFANEKARKTYEKIQKLKGKFAKSKKEANDKNMELPNLIAAVAIISPTYNLLNIWDLTVYQFYDQFSRLDRKIQFEVYGQRWATWGQDEFDFSIWRKALQKS